MMCPQCQGEHLGNEDPRGPLAFRHSLDCPLLPALDTIHAHEAKNLGAPLERDPTDAERILAVHLDPSLEGSDFHVLARRVTASIIHRSIITY